MTDEKRNCRYDLEVEHGWSDVDISEAFEFFEHLRESGAVNMFGAPSVIAAEWGLGRAESKLVWLAWVESKKEEV